MSRNNKSNNQFILHDAVHGAIDLRMLSSEAENEKLFEILNSSFLNRLRRVKQLGFASYSHSSADHSRYAHAIGTMHVMKLLFDRLESESEKGNGFNEIINDVEKCFSVKGKPDVKKHLLLAGLLQDIGILPYSQGTESLITPNENTRKTVCDEIGYDSEENLDDKKVFTIAAINQPELKKLLSDLHVNLPFLVFLLTGHNSNKKVEANECVALLHMVDGEVDADRLDYTFRDGHHTYGYSGTPTLVISSLLGYDKVGPIFNDTGAISEYFLKRGHLWTTVYFEPENRFNNNLLKTFLKLYFTKCNSIPAHNKHLKAEISIKEFEHFDDVQLFEKLNKILKEQSDSLDERCGIALKQLLQNTEKYEWFWLPEKEAYVIISKKPLPDDVFYDTFSNYYDHKLFRKCTVQIKSAIYEKLEQPLYLEDCSGAFTPLKNTEWVTLPKRNSILVFTPTKKGGGETWKTFTNALSDNSLYDLIIFHENGGHNLPPSDTWDNDDFKGKKIFISYAFSDRNEVDKIVYWLHDKKKKYKLVRDPEHGTGSTPYENSVNGIQKADIILMVASTNYVERNNDGGNVRAEIFEMVKLNKRPYPLPIDNFEKVSTLPWSQLGFIGTPVANDLRNLSLKQFESYVTEVLNEIDRNGSK